MLKVGVFGVGHLGKYHLSNWQQIEGVEVVGFYDPGDVVAQEVSEKYQLARFIDAGRLMDAVDAVDIVAPTNYHFDLCSKAIRKGKHVFVEKPPCKTLVELKDLIATQNSHICMVGLQRRFKRCFAPLSTNRRLVGKATRGSSLQGLLCCRGQSFLPKSRITSLQEVF